MGNLLHTGIPFPLLPRCPVRQHKGQSASALAQQGSNLRHPH